MTDEEVEREIMRMLWIFHWTSTAQLARLIWGSNTGRHRTRLRPILQRLYDYRSDLAHELALFARLSRAAARRGLRRMVLWADEAGKNGGCRPASRADHRALHDARGLLKATERRALHHSGHYSEFCTGLIEELRHHPVTTGLFIETECTRLGTHLRMDGLLRVRLRRSPGTLAPSAEPSPWFVPWMAELSGPLAAGMVDVTLAIEIDEGTEELAIIEQKAENYRRTYLAGLQGSDGSAIPAVAWPEMLCPPQTPADPHVRRLFFPVPVFVVLGPQRLVNVWEAWQRGWSGSELRITSWQHIHEAGSIVRAPYVNQRREMVDLIGHPHPYAGRLPWSSR